MQERFDGEVREAPLNDPGGSTGRYKAKSKFCWVQRGVGSAHSTEEKQDNKTYFEDRLSGCGKGHDLHHASHVS